MSKAIMKGSLSDIANREGMSVAESFLSAEIIALVDVSGSMGTRDAPGKITRLQAAKNQLVELQQSYPGKIALVCFSDYPVFVSGGDLINCGISTAMHKALKLVKVADDTGLKIVLITDGEPDDRNATLAIAKTFKSRIDAIYIGREGGSGMDFLNELMSVTGGKAFASEAPGMLSDGVEVLLLGG